MLTITYLDTELRVLNRCHIISYSFVYCAVPSHVCLCDWPRHRTKEKEKDIHHVQVFVRQSEKKKEKKPIQSDLYPSLPPPTLPPLFFESAQNMRLGCDSCPAGIHLGTCDVVWLGTSLYNTQ